MCSAYAAWVPLRRLCIPSTTLPFLRPVRASLDSCYHISSAALHRRVPTNLALALISSAPWSCVGMFCRVQSSRVSQNG